jgi:predicted aconitase
MQLTDEEQRILQGESGEAERIAMRVLTKLGEANGADRMIPVVSAHLVGCSYQIAGEAGIQIYTQLVEQGAKVKVPTTLDPGSIDFKKWEEFRIPSDYAKRQFLIANLLEKMGVIPTWTCTPYYLLNIPHFGEDVAWSESSAVAFINSVIGSRTNRMSAYLDLCAAIIGKVPRFGLHLPENRRGEILLEIEPDLAAKFDDVHFPPLGYFMGEIAEDKIPVISGLRSASFDQLKFLSAAAASTGSVALYHIVGITPEAQTLKMVFGKRRPARTWRIGLKEIEETIDRMSTFRGGKVDAVAVGCPHASVSQMQRYAHLLKDQNISAGVEFWVCTNEIVETISRKMGYCQGIEKAGGKILVGTCHNDCPLGAWKFNSLVTDSGKFAYYTPTTVGSKCFYTSLSRCVQAAIEGKI